MTDNLKVSREMPKYKCHKEVWALKIKAIKILSTGVGRITPAEDGYGDFMVSREFLKKIPDSNDTGYFVRYQDGYESWSPTKAFEEGYSLVE